MATEVVVTQADIDDVAKKLDEFGAVLNDKEKGILLGILGVAKQAIDKVAESTPATTPADAKLPSLSAGFRNAFQKGVGTKFTIDQGQGEEVSATLSVGVKK